MKKIMHYISIVLLLIGFSSQLNAQVFSNSWINFNNIYFKFKVGNDDIYRISKTKLDSLGFSNISGNQFAIFHIVRNTS